MSTETLFIHILWASVSSTALYVTYKCVERYTTVKSLEALALASERVGAMVLQVLKESGGRRIGNFSFPVANGTRQNRPHHHTSAQTEQDHNTHANPLFDLRN